MFLLLAKTHSSIPWFCWVVGVVALLTGASFGFWIGYTLGKDATKRRIKQAGKEISQLVDTILETLNIAHSACAKLESLKTLKLSKKHQQKLETTQTTLFHSLENIIEKSLAEEKKEEPSLKVDNKKTQEKKKKNVELVWELLPQDDLTKLPRRAAFDISLERLLQYCQTNESEAGLLFVKIDKYAQLESRFDKTGALKFYQSMGALIVKAMRDEDLLCQYNNGTFALLMPDIDLPEGKERVHAIRSVIRHHRFRLDSGSPEVLVTASFGYTQCTPTDATELAINRARNGLERSQRRGRNQLHISAGNQLIHC